MNCGVSENDYEGILIKTSPWNFETVEKRAAHFGKAFSDKVNQSYVIASVPSYLAKSFREYFKRSEIPYYNLENNQNEGD